MKKTATKGIDDLETTYPELAQEWHPTLNAGLLPSDVLPGSGKRVYWQCPKCNYVWDSKISNRAVLGRGCPCCANKVVVKGINDLATTHPEIAKEWYQPLNGDVTPYDVTHGCGKKFSWLCPRGHVYSATVLHRTNGAGTKCPVCNSGRQTSFAEQALYYYVKKVYPTAISGYKEIFTRSMELDVYIPDLKIGIEYDGVYWHHKKAAAYEREQRKYDICKENGITLIQVREKRKHVDEVPAADWCVFSPETESDEVALSISIKNVITWILDQTKNGSIPSVPDIDVTRDRFEILSYLKGPVNNSVQEIAPELAEEWDYERNGELKPDMISAGSSQYVNWICSTCGYRWEAEVYHRAKDHTGCPKCAGFIFEKGVNDLETKMPELLADWDYEENARHDIYPGEIMFNSGKKVHWKCHICGHRWTVSLNKRTVQGNGCIKCGYKAGKDNNVFLSPTGRAARRITESTGYPAKTIHSALGLGIVDDERFADTKGFNEECLVNSKVIVDEASMIDLWTMEGLLRNIKDSTLGLIGDVDQLPSVRCGSILRDLIQSGAVSCVQLDTIHRQSADALNICENAQNIKNGLHNLNTGDDFHIVEAEDLETAEENLIGSALQQIYQYGLENVKVLCPFKKGACGVYRVNNILQNVLNPSKGENELKIPNDMLLRAGDPVMQLKNIDDVANGDVGYVIEITFDEVKVLFPGENPTSVDYSYNDAKEQLTLAYATTVHKSQGSEYDSVVLCLTQRHGLMKKRNILYTGITRGKHQVTLIGTYDAFYESIDNNMIEVRHSMLAELVASTDTKKPSVAPIVTMPKKPEYEQMVLPFA